MPLTAEFTILYWFTDEETELHGGEVMDRRQPTGTGPSCHTPGSLPSSSPAILMPVSFVPLMRQ